MIDPRQKSPRREWEKQIDEAWEVANLTLDDEQRKKGFETIQKIFIEECPWIYTYNVAIMSSYRTTFNNIKLHPVNSFDGIFPRMYQAVAY